MTYFDFLGSFLLIPIAILAGLTLCDQRRGMKLPVELGSWSPWPVIIIHLLIAVSYTTLWDNYLVATGVWWYDPNLVTGLTIGWVPIEEYTFFVLQPILIGLWLFYWLHRWPVSGNRSSSPYRFLRWLTTVVAGLIWLTMLFILLIGWRPGTYLALQLVWALPPIMLQLAFGADILWRHRWLVLLGVLPPTLYLSLADSIAIMTGIWTIDPAQSLQIMIGGVLPLEEVLFFLLTTVLLVFGITLTLARESQVRFRALRMYYKSRIVEKEFEHEAQAY